MLRSAHFFAPPAAAPAPPPPASAPGPSEPVSSFAFPPGLLPRLCRDKEKVHMPYTPLDPAEIASRGEHKSSV